MAAASSRLLETAAPIALRSARSARATPSRRPGAPRGSTGRAGRRYGAAARRESDAPTGPGHELTAAERSGSCDREDLPRIADALEGVCSAILELELGAGGEVPAVLFRPRAQTKLRPLGRGTPVDEVSSPRPNQLGTAADTRPTRRARSEVMGLRFVIMEVMSTLRQPSSVAPTLSEPRAPPRASLDLRGPRGGRAARKVHRPA